jgi:hypothetical protein
MNTGYVLLVQCSMCRLSFSCAMFKMEWTHYFLFYLQDRVLICWNLHAEVVCIKICSSLCKISGLLTLCAFYICVWMCFGHAIYHWFCHRCAMSKFEYSPKKLEPKWSSMGWIMILWIEYVILHILLPSCLNLTCCWTHQHLLEELLTR